MDFTQAVGSAEAALHAILPSDSKSSASRRAAAFHLKDFSNCPTPEIRIVTQNKSPLPEGTNWRLDALCQEISPALFFHPTNERGAKRRKRIAEVKKICSKCPVQ
jgi:hypothetical protein